MDIAKIRKKLKETDSGSNQPGAESKAAEQQQAQAWKEDKNISAPSVEPSPEEIEYQTDSGESEPPFYESRESIEHEEAVADHIETTPAAGSGPNRPEEKIASHEDEGKTKIRIEESRTEEIIEILTFKLFKEEFAFRISQLKEILKYQRITKVPKMPDYVVGITSLRGKVIPVIDLRTKVSSHTELPGLTDRIKILIIKGPKGLIGAVVDKIIGVVRIAKSEILPPPSHLTEEQLKFIDGIAIIDKRFVSILNMEETISMHFN